jgi:putative acetyltransferase
VATHGALLTIREVHQGEALAIVRRLFEEYAASLGFSVCFQGFDQELAGLPGAYAPPGGRLLLGWSGSEPCGCVALRPLESAVCEMKRLYVRPAYRGSGLGRRLAERLIAEAEGAGYERLRLDTLPSMGAALQLYRRLGFREIPPYTSNPAEGAVFLELALHRAHQ